MTLSLISLFVWKENIWGLVLAHRRHISKLKQKDQSPCFSSGYTWVLWSPWCSTCWWGLNKDMGNRIKSSLIALKTLQGPFVNTASTSTPTFIPVIETPLRPCLCYVYLLHSSLRLPFNKTLPFKNIFGAGILSPTHLALGTCIPSKDNPESWARIQLRTEFYPKLETNWGISEAEYSTFYVQARLPHTQEAAWGCLRSPTKQSFILKSDFFF